MAGSVFAIPIHQIDLYEENPRHGAITDEDEIITYLLQDEQVYELAKSIAEHETNPLELVGVVAKGNDSNGDPIYEVWEGNRRICAIILLNHPEKAPKEYRKRFQVLSDSIELIESIDGRLFENHEELRFWMRNIHNGAQSGRGRKDWGPDEQHRDNPTKKYAIAFTLLEMAEQKGWVTKSQRKGKLSTLQRYVGHTALAPILKPDDSNPESVKFGIKKSNLNKLTKVLIADLIAGNISSRHNEEEISGYAAKFEKSAGVSDEGGTVENDKGDSSGKSDDGTAGPSGSSDSSPQNTTKIKIYQDLQEAIAATGVDKLTDLYGSLVKVSAKSNPQLIAIGCWALIEIITSLSGYDHSFANYFQGSKLQKLGLKKDEAKTAHQVFKRLSEGGNTAKHHAVSTNFDYKQLINDMDVISPILAKELKNIG